MLSLGTGYMSYAPKDKDYDLEHVFGAIGINRYTFDNRGKFSINAGIVNRYRWTWGSPSVTSHNAILPYAEFTFTYYALKFRRPYFYHKSNDINDYQPSLYYTFAFLGRYFNPAGSIGAGGVHAMGFSPAMRLNLGPVYVNFSALSIDTRDQNTTQVGVNAFKIKLLKSYHSYVTASWLGLYNYEYLPGRYSYGYQETRVSNGILVGLNNYKLDSRFSITALVGALRQNYNSAYSNRSDRTIPFGQLSYNVHLFKYRPVGYVLQPQRVKKTRYKAQKPNKTPMTTAQVLRNNINPRISLGAGMTHAAFFMPTIGAKIWRADAGVSVVELGGEPWFSVYGDIDAIPLSHDASRWITIGVSGMGSYDTFFGVHTGLKRYKGRTAKSLKLGLGVYSEFGGGGSVIPSLDFSYHLYLFKMKFRPLKKVPHNPFNPRARCDVE